MVGMESRVVLAPTLGCGLKHGLLRGRDGWAGTHGLSDPDESHGDYNDRALIRIGWGGLGCRSIQAETAELELVRDGGSLAAGREPKLATVPCGAWAGREDRLRILNLQVGDLGLHL